jgi:hypothetical protein
MVSWPHSTKPIRKFSDSKAAAYFTEACPLLAEPCRVSMAITFVLNLPVPSFCAMSQHPLHPHGGVAATDRLAILREVAGSRICLCRVACNGFCDAATLRAK